MSAHTHSSASELLDGSLDSGSGSLSSKDEGILTFS